MMITNLDSSVFDRQREPGIYDDLYMEFRPRKTWSALLAEGQIIVKGTRLTRATADVSGILLVPDGITDIGDEALRACTNLTRVMLPNTIKNIGLRAFPMNTNLSIYIPNNVNIFRAQLFREDEED